MSICICVCIFVSARISQKSHVKTSRNFLYTLIYGVARSFYDDTAIRYVLPVLWMTSYLAIISQAKATTIRRRPILIVTQQGQKSSVIFAIA